MLMQGRKQKWRSRTPSKEKNRKNWAEQENVKKHSNSNNGLRFEQKRANAVNGIELMKLSIICTSCLWLSLIWICVWVWVCVWVGATTIYGQHVSVMPATAIIPTKICIVIIWQSIQVDIKYPAHKFMYPFCGYMWVLVSCERTEMTLTNFFLKFASLSNQLLLAIKWALSPSQMTRIIEMKYNSVIRFLFIYLLWFLWSIFSIFWHRCTV